MYFHKVSIIHSNNLEQVQLENINYYYPKMFRIILLCLHASNTITYPFQYMHDVIFYSIQ